MVRSRKRAEPGSPSPAAAGTPLRRPGTRMLLLWLALLPGIPVPARPHEAPVRTVEVVASVRGTARTPEEARREALQRARLEAIQQVGGIDLSASDWRIKGEDPQGFADAFAAAIQTSTRGRIVKETVHYETLLDGETPVYRVRLRADVALEKDQEDPGFRLRLRAVPESHTFRAGEQLQVTLTASRDCYITLLDVLSSDRMVLLFPNRLSQENHLTAGQSLTLPSPSQRERGLALRMVLPEGKSRDAGLLLALATRDPLPLPFGTTGVSGRTRTRPLQPSLVALNRWLVGIPAARRAQAVWAYRIVP
ncbi:MAG: DUF4384 domain-containing protein [Acidobacteriota bacterium]